ncbi:hypothetical protein BTUL_0191g00240 [Botrytis tulipae]|uniref:Uncharacterized protein n=1 Tax=Botrytis tulipae TaxID=87230 RepID=A0A4Z1E9D3_9HELO|nr:hypothetical protein BTUL_0191g00240 [Botrytis tulipae]
MSYSHIIKVVIGSIDVHKVGSPYWSLERGLLLNVDNLTSTGSTCKHITRPGAMEKETFND